MDQIGQKLFRMSSSRGEKTDAASGVDRRGDGEDVAAAAPGGVGSRAWTRTISPVGRIVIGEQSTAAMSGFASGSMRLERR